MARSTSPLSPAQRAQVAPLLHPSVGTHRWLAERPAGYFGGGRITVRLVDPTLVVEVCADNVYAQGRWCHLTGFVRVRPDLASDSLSLR